MTYTATLLTTAMIYVIVTVSLNLVQGEAGIFTIAQTAFLGIGAYTTAVLTIKHGLPVLLTFPIAIAIGGVIAAALFVPVARLTGLLQVIITFAFVLVMTDVFQSATSLTNGEYGLPGVPLLSVGTLSLAGTYQMLAAFVVLAAIVVCLAVAIKRSPLGLIMRATRDDSRATQASGQRVGRVRFLAFVLGGAIAALAGSMYAVMIGYIDPTPFTPDLAFLVVAMLILGGSGNIAGAVLGAIVLSALPNLINTLPISSTSSGAIEQIVYALLLLAALRFRPDGLLTQRAGIARLRRSAAPVVGAGIAAVGTSPDQEIVVESSVPSTPHMTSVAIDPGPARPRVTHGGALKLEGLRRSFGNLNALDDVSVSVQAGEHVGIIGANGAGKTTLLNVLSGLDRGGTGRLWHNGVEITGWSMDAIARAGILRTFQDVRVFPELTVTENLLAYACPATQLCPGGSAVRGPRGFTDEAMARVTRAIDRLGLAGVEKRRVGQLSFGQQKLVTLGRALCTDSDVLLFDEPMSGLAESEIGPTLDLIRSIGAEKTVVVVEHKMDVVFGFADRVVLMNRGKVVVDGPSELVREHEEVRGAFLGLGVD